jgi:formylglycine-generating enzyme required for sulfatase activity
LGSPPTEPDRDSGEVAHRERIHHKFAVATNEVSLKQYQEFMRENPGFSPAHRSLDGDIPNPEGPVSGVNWFAAVAYCNWLSKREGLPEDEWCYLRNPKREFDLGMTIPADVLKRTGYRLPIEAEWEYACRAGSVTIRYYGSSVDLLSDYAVYADDGVDAAWSVGQLLPNDLGLFDMLGNVWEWCDEHSHRYSVARGRTSRSDEYVSGDVDARGRLLRGGSFDDGSWRTRAACRKATRPADGGSTCGFRPVRTYY